MKGTGLLGRVETPRRQVRQCWGYGLGFVVIGISGEHFWNLSIGMLQVAELVEGDERSDCWD